MAGEPRGPGPPLISCTARKSALAKIMPTRSDDRGGMGRDLSIGCVILVLGLTLCMIIGISGVGIVFYGLGQDDVQSIEANTDFDPGDLIGGTAPCNVEGAPFGAGNVTELTCASHRVILAEFEGGVLDGNCRRPGTGGYGDEHPLGQACDYMISPIGVMPNGNQKTNGDRIATFARDNYEELGVLYIIWYNKIWNPRQRSSDEPGLALTSWRDYGQPYSVTLGHFDHPHISFCGPRSPNPDGLVRPCP